MRTTTLILYLLVFLSSGQPAGHAASNWPQFRGPDGQAAATDGKTPAQFGATTNLLWKAALPPGHSSPCIWGDRIFLTGFENGELETFCLDRRDGRVLWRTPVTAEKVEPFHRLGSPAAPTPATDGERVFVYFGSLGLIAYDYSGH